MSCLEEICFDEIYPINECRGGGGRAECRLNQKQVSSETDTTYRYAHSEHAGPVPSDNQLCKCYNPLLQHLSK